MWGEIAPPYQTQGTNLMFIDAVAFNLVEFWTGETVDIGTSISEAGLQVALEPGSDDSTAMLTLRRDDQELARLSVIRVSPERFEVRDAGGALQGLVVRGEDNGLLLCDAHGETISALTPEMLEAVAAR